MEIRWINGKYTEDSRIFDSKFEAEEWADSLYPDFAGNGFVNCGYATADLKVWSYLVLTLPSWLKYAHGTSQIPCCTVGSSTENTHGRTTYRVWVTPCKDTRECKQED